MYLSIDHRKIHYKKIGKGAPLLMVHGWGGSMYSLLELAHLAASEYTVYLIDLPGFGKSDPPPPHWGVKGYAQLVTNIINILGIHQCVYFGHSFGGELGIYLAAQDNPVITSLFLCNTSYKRTNTRSIPARILNTLPYYSQLKNHPVFSHIRKLYYSLFLRRSDIHRYPALESNLRNILIQDLTPETARIRIPVTIIWGEKDTVTPVILAYDLKHRIPQARLCIHPDATHNLPIKSAQLVWEDMRT